MELLAPSFESIYPIPEELKKTHSADPLHEISEVCREEIVERERILRREDSKKEQEQNRIYFHYLFLKYPTNSELKLYDINSLFRFLSRQKQLINIGFNLSSINQNDNSGFIGAPIVDRDPGEKIRVSSIDKIQEDRSWHRNKLQCQEMIHQGKKCLHFFTLEDFFLKSLILKKRIKNIHRRSNYNRIGSFDGSNKGAYFLNRQGVRPKSKNSRASSSTFQQNTKKILRLTSFKYIHRRTN